MPLVPCTASVSLTLCQNACAPSSPASSGVPRDACSRLESGLWRVTSRPLEIAAQVVETVLRFRDHREKIIRNCVTSNIPWLATFAPERFACAYLGTCMVHLQNVLRNASSVERGIGFTALGLLSKSMTSARGVAGLAPHLQPVASAMKELFAKRKKSTPGWNEAIVCAGQIAQHLGATPRPSTLKDEFTNSIL